MSTRPGSPTSPPPSCGPSRRRPSASTTCTPRPCRSPSTSRSCARGWPSWGRRRSRALTVDCASPLEVIARFMGLLELFREATIALDQPECFGELTVRWTPPHAGRPDAAGPDAPDRPSARWRRLRRVTTDEPAVDEGLPDLTDDAALEAALEALLLVVDAPTEDDALATALDQPVARVRAALLRPRAALRRRRAAGSTCAGRGRAGGSTPATPTPPSSSGSCWTASAPSSPGPRWRPSPWSPTASR